MWLIALFILLPIIEIGLFIQVGGWIGLWPTLGLVRQRGDGDGHTFWPGHAGLALHANLL